MTRDLIPLYDGAIKANRVGSFQKDGHSFDVIRPGYDSQGRRRTSWTQFVYRGYPIFEVKVHADLARAIKQFEDRWAQSVTPNPELFEQGMRNAIAERKSKFKDGKSGFEPAPALRVDGRPDGTRRPS